MAEAGVHLAKAQVSAFDLNLGVNASTGGGIKDDSVELKLLGTGF
jgi:hypothetical protein